jgi:hypothetical protein
VTTTSKQTVRKGSTRGRTGDDWDRAYVESFLEKYCRDTPAAVEERVEPLDLELARMTERERIIAEELTAKLEEPETADPAPGATAPRTPGSSTSVVLLSYVAVILAIATSGLVLLSR